MTLLVAECRDDIWSQIKIDDAVEPCSYCGQARMYGVPMCKMCFICQNTIVLGIARKLLLIKGNKINRSIEEESDESMEKALEIALHEILDKFPFELANRSRRVHKLLMTAGVWFSHLMAFCTIQSLRQDKKIPLSRFLSEKVYLHIRDQTFQFLASAENSYPEGDFDMIMSVYRSYGSGVDARSVIGSMIHNLDKDGKIKLERQEKCCVRCKKELTGLSILCAECQKEDRLKTRLIINAGTKHLSQVKKDENVAVKHDNKESVKNESHAKQM